MQVSGYDNLRDKYYFISKREETDEASVQSTRMAVEKAMTGTYMSVRSTDNSQQYY